MEGGMECGGRDGVWREEVVGRREGVGGWREGMGRDREGVS